MADIIKFPRKTAITDQEKTVLWVIKVVDNLVKFGQAKECNLHITEKGLKDIEGFKPEAEDIANAVEYLQREGAIVL
jgi:hypothetical protein